MLVIWASPNVDGLTASAKDRVIAGATAGAAEVREVHLNKLHMEHCKACGDGWGLCKAKGHCVIKDDFEELYQAAKDADGIVLVTAVYWHDMAECMKAFVDRMRRCETGYGRTMVEKKVLLVACAGGTGRGATYCLHNMEEALNHMQMSAVDRIPVIQFNKSYMLPAVEAAGKAFAEAVRS